MAGHVKVCTKTGAGPAGDPRARWDPQQDDRTAGDPRARWDPRTGRPDRRRSTRTTSWDPRQDDRTAGDPRARRAGTLDRTTGPQEIHAHDELGPSTGRPDRRRSTRTTSWDPQQDDRTAGDPRARRAGTLNRTTGPQEIHAHDELGRFMVLSLAFTAVYIN